MDCQKRYYQQYKTGKTQSRAKPITEKKLEQHIV